MCSYINDTESADSRILMASVLAFAAAIYFSKDFKWALNIRCLLPCAAVKLSLNLTYIFNTSNIVTYYNTTKIWCE